MSDLPRSVQRASAHQQLLISLAIGGLGLGVGAGSVAVMGGVQLLPIPSGDAQLLALLGAGGLALAAAALPAWLIGAARVRVAEAHAAETALHAARAAVAVPPANALFSADASGTAAMQREEEQRRLVQRAGWPQAALAAPAALAGLVLAIAVCAGVLVPRLPSAPQLALALSAIAFAFPVLVLERRCHALAAAGDDLPEARGLARLLRLLLWLLVGGGAAGVLVGYGLPFAGHAVTVLALLAAAFCGELALRACAVPFIPVARAAEARGLGDTLLGGLLLGRLNPLPRAAAHDRDGDGGGLAGSLKERFGIDVDQSFAMQTLRRLAPRVTLGLLGLGWLLTGITVLSLRERGVLERGGAPVAVLQPGLHVHLPWPFAEVRRSELGVVHRTVLRSDARAATEAAESALTDRMWDVRHAGESDLLVPGAASSAAVHLVSCHAQVFWRIGPSDDDVRHAAYVFGTQDREALVRQVAMRQLLTTCATQSLDALLGADRAELGKGLAARIQADLDRLAGPGTAGSSGLRIDSVVIDAIHPPVEAARAYQAVQAQRIASLADRRAAVGRASRQRAEADRSAGSATLAALALAGEVLAAAKREEARFAADRSVNGSGADVLRLERWLQALARRLKNAQLTIIDHRLELDHGPIIDLRRPAPANQDGNRPDAPASR